MEEGERAQEHCRIVTINILMATLKEIIELQKICCHSLTNLILIEWTRSQDFSKADIKALLYTTYSPRERIDIFGQTSND